MCLQSIFTAVSWETGEIKNILFASLFHINRTLTMFSHETYTYFKQGGGGQSGKGSKMLIFVNIFQEWKLIFHYLILVLGYSFSVIYRTKWKLGNKILCTLQHGEKC
jgi:hypothetical protein